MMTVTLCLISFAAGVMVAGAYARLQITKIKRDDLTFHMAPTIEDAARRVGA